MTRLATAELTEGTMHIFLLLIMPLVFVAIGWPMARRALPPNAVWGIRVPFTLASSRAWYETNALAGRTLVGAGLAGVPVIFVVALWPATLDADTRSLVAVGCVLLLVLGSLLVSLVVAHRRYGHGP